jgi:nucleotide-binding universal stress UspA family protein
MGEAAKDPGTLITMSPHGRSRLSHWWMGSVVDKVLHFTKNPLLIIHADHRQQAARQNAFERIKVPVDSSHLVETILPQAVYLSAALGIAVNLVQAVPSQDEYDRHLSLRPAKVTCATLSYEEYAQIVDGEAESYLSELKDRLTQGVALLMETQLLHDPPADCVANLANATANNLIAMTTPRPLPTREAWCWTARLSA